MKKFQFCCIVIVTISIIMCNTWVYARPIYVNENAAGNNNGSSWQNAYTDLQSAFSQADGVLYTQIWVAAGKYVPGTEASDTFQLTNNVAVYGGFAGTESNLDQRDWTLNYSILSGDIGRDDWYYDMDEQNTHIVDYKKTLVYRQNAFSVVTCRNVSSTAVLDGFYIVSGIAVEYDESLEQNYYERYFPQNIAGGGIYCINSSPVFKHLTISGSVALAGAGIYCYNSEPDIDKVTILKNYSHYIHSAPSLGDGAGIFFESYDVIKSPNLCNIIITENDSEWYGGGIYCSNTNLKLTNVEIFKNTAKNGGGIYCSSNIEMYNVKIFENSAEGDGGGICFIGRASTIFNNVMILQNTASRGGGIYCGGWQNQLSLNNVNISENVSSEFGGGIFCEQSMLNQSNVLISNNQAVNGGGIYMIAGCELGFSSSEKCSIFDNQAGLGSDIYNTSQSDPNKIILETFSVLHPTPFHVYPQDHLTFDIQKAKYEQISSDLYVSPKGDDSNRGTSPDSPFKNINHALSVILADKTNPRVIYLDGGTYSPETGTVFPVSMVSYVTLSGKGAEKTILDANHTFGVLHVESAQNVCIKDVKIINGNSVISHPFGGGINCFNSNLILNNLIISGNRSRFDGGGISLLNSSSFINNVMITGNRSERNGGGLYIKGSPSTFISHSTISRNLAEDSGVCIYSSNIQMSNSIIWNNKGSETLEINSSNYTITNCIIQGGYDGTNILDEDPLFIEPASQYSPPFLEGNFRLQYGSPAINAGTNESIPNDLADSDGDGITGEKIPYDLDGHNRIGLQTVDIGAYEFNSPKIFPIETQTIPEDTMISNILFTIDGVETSTDALNITAISLDTTKVANKNISVSGAGAERILSITPTANENGQVSISVIVYDSNSLTASTNFILSILPVNDPPVAMDSTAFLDEDRYLNLLMKASDIDDDDLTYTIVTHPTNGSLEPEGNFVLYRPHQDYNGRDYFSFKVNDGEYSSNEANIVLTIYPVPDPPVSHSQTVNTTENNPINITLFANDADGDDLTYAIYDPPHNGKISGQPPNLTYNPNQWFWGADTFTFYTNDGVFDSEPAQINVTTSRAEQYSLTLLSNNPCQISVNSIHTLPPWTKMVGAEEQVCFEALPNTDWMFVDWIGDIHTSQNPTCITMDRAKSITANLSIQQFLLNIYGHEAITINHQDYSLPVNQYFDIHSMVSIHSKSETFKCWKSNNMEVYENPFEFILNSNMNITPVFYPIPIWKSEIAAERKVEESIGQYSRTVHIGIASQAYTKAEINLPELYSCDVKLFDINWNTCSENIQQSNNNNEHIWVISVDPQGNIGNQFFDTTATLRWNPQSLSSTGNYMLLKGHDGKGDTLISDMRSITEYQITGNSYQNFSIIWQKVEAFCLKLNHGWNLISLPIIPENMDVNVLFPGCIAAFEYKAGSYYPASQITPGKGYWIKVSSQSEYNIVGQLFTKYTTLLSEGWHLIGAIDIETEPSDDNIVALYQYAEGQYEIVSVLKPGIGYWVKMQQEAEFRIGY